MCGIAGFVGGGNREDAKRMASAMTHRGPDGEGFYHDPDYPVHLVHRRLSVIDVAGGQQPMWNEGGQIGVVFNGEIYNHRALRADLTARGHVFKTHHSDTEVLIHGWKEWGQSLPDRLNGMFAFAILDRGSRCLFLARDRFGKKPLFYTDQPSLFAFASELSALTAHSQVNTTVDPAALQKFFAYSLFPGAVTPYGAIRKLPAGHFLVRHFDGGPAARVTPYWQFRIEPDERLAEAPESEIAENVLHLLMEAVRRRLESDVPLGILLSGGVDSSAVLALAARAVPASDLHTFAIGFDERSFDESAFAERMAAFVGARHSVRICRMDDGRATISDRLALGGEPMGDPSVLPTAMVCEFARESVTVALGGDGGDELFAGYDPFKALKTATLYSKLVPRPLHRAILALAECLPVTSGNMGLDFKIRRGLRGAGYEPALWNPVWMGALAPSEVAELFSEPLPIENLFEEAITTWETCASTDPVDRTLEFYTRIYLQDGILTKADRASMMHSLELRSPFLDHDLVEYVRRLPAKWKFRNGERKYILKRSLAGIVPEDILNRRKKGFGIPLARWLRDVKPPAVGSGNLPGLDEQWLAARWKRHASGRADFRGALWCWLALREWRERSGVSA
jgi:asparagine synthase (glutamine-hydrolysing)